MLELKYTVTPDRPSCAYWTLGRQGYLQLGEASGVQSGEVLAFALRTFATYGSLQGLGTVHGFVPVHTWTRARWNLRMHQRQGHGMEEIMEVTGHLRVTDPERFMMALRKGIGKGRAQGLGLLLTWTNMPPSSRVRTSPVPAGVDLDAYLEAVPRRGMNPQPQLPRRVWADWT